MKIHTQNKHTETYLLEKVGLDASTQQIPSLVEHKLDEFTEPVRKKKKKTRMGKHKDENKDTSEVCRRRLFSRIHIQNNFKAPAKTAFSR